MSKGISVKDEHKSKSQLLAEVRSLRQQLISRENFLKGQRDQAEKALRESEVNLRTFMENARGFGVYSLEAAENEEYGTELIFVSPSIKDILGIDNPEDNTSWFEGLHPDDIERMAAAHHFALTVSSEFDETYRFYHKDKKEWRWGRAISSLVTVEGSTSKRFNGLVLDVTDIKRAEEALNKSYDELEIRVKERTADLSEANEQLHLEIGERKLVEEALLQSQGQLQRYVTAIDDIGVGLCVIDADHNVRVKNSTLTTWFGDHLDDNCHSIIMGLGQPCSNCMLSDVVEEGKKVRYYPDMADGKSYEIVATPITNSDGTISKMLIIRDITEQKAQEERRLKISQQKEQLKKHASLKNMAGAVAHRFNNAMTGVQGNLELLTLTLPDKSRELQMASNAYLAARGASQVSSMMLSYVGQRSLQLEEVSFADLVQETVTAFKDDKSLLVSLEIIPPEKALYCLVDVPQIAEALKSVFTNSIESMGDRSGTIKVNFGTATISNDALPLFFQDDSIKNDSYVFCQIEDSGHGVSQENLEHIFDPFYTTRSTGRGLGLALTAGIMQTHNGAITIDSIPDESTTVRMLLPSISLS